MPEIKYRFDVEGIGSLEKLPETLQRVEQSEASLAKQMLNTDEIVSRSAATVSNLGKALSGLSASGVKIDPAILGEVGALGQAFTQIASTLRSLNSQRLTLDVDDRASAKISQATKNYEQFANRVAQEGSRAQLAAIPAQLRPEFIAGQQVEHLGLFRGVARQEDRDEVERQINETARLRTLTAQVTPIATGTENLEASAQKAAEATALVLRGEEGVLGVRKQALEVTRQNLLATAKTAEAQQAIHQAINQRIVAEERNTGAQVKLRDAQQEIAVREKIAALEDQTNRATLTAVEREIALRDRLLATYKNVSPASRTQLESVFQRRIENAEKEDAGGGRSAGGSIFNRSNVISQGVLAAQAPQFAALSAVGNLASTLGPVGIAVTATAVAVGILGKALSGLVESEGRAAESLGNFASRLGLTVNQASALSAEAQIAGVNIETLQGAARYLAQALEDPAGAGLKQAKALREMGIALVTATGDERELGQVTLDVIDKLSGYPTAAERAFRAAQLLGRSGAKELLPLIEQHRQLSKEVAALGFANVEELTKALDKADDEFDKLHLSAQLLKKELAGLAVPIVIPIIRQITNVLSGRGFQSGVEDDARQGARESLEQQIKDFEEKQKQATVLRSAITPPAPGKNAALEGNALQEAKIAFANLQADIQKATGPIEQARARLTELNKPVPTDQLNLNQNPELARILQQSEAELRQQAAPDAARERTRLLQTREGLESRAAVLKQTIREEEGKLTTDAFTIGRDALHAQVTKDEAELKQIEARIKALGDGTENRFEKELQRQRDEQFLSAHPESLFGRIPQIQVQLGQRIQGFEEDKKLRVSQREILESGERDSANRRIIEEARRVAGRNILREIGETELPGTPGIAGLPGAPPFRSTLKADLESKEREFSTLQEITRIERGREETVEDVNQAYREQLRLATEIRDSEQGALEHGKRLLAAQGGTVDEATAREVRTRQNAINEQFSKAQADAEANRRKQVATVEAREREARLHTEQEIAQLNIEAENHAYQLRIDHATRLAEITRGDLESPLATVERAYQTQLKLAQAQHDALIASNALTYPGTEGPTFEQRRIEDARALKQLNEETQKAEYEREEKLAALRRREHEEAKQAAASLYDALRGGPEGIKGFFKQQADQIGRNLFSSLTAPLFQGLSHSINPSGGGVLGDIFRGTVFGGSTGVPPVPRQTRLPGTQGLETGTALDVFAPLPGAPPITQDTRAHGFLGHLERFLGIPSVRSGAPDPSVSEAPSPFQAVTGHIDRQVLSLEHNTTSIDALTQAILGLRPGELAPLPEGGIGLPGTPSALTHPAAGSGETGIPGVTELALSGIAKSAQDAVTASRTLTENAPKFVAPIPVPLAQQDQAEEKPPLQPPVFSPNINVPPQEKPHVTVHTPAGPIHIPVEPPEIPAPIVNVAPATPAESRDPLHAPVRPLAFPEQEKQIRITPDTHHIRVIDNFPTTGKPASEAAWPWDRSEYGENPPSDVAKYGENRQTGLDKAQASSLVSPHGFPTLGTVAAAGDLTQLPYPLFAAPSQLPSQGESSPVRLAPDTHGIRVGSGLPEPPTQERGQAQQFVDTLRTDIPQIVRGLGRQIGATVSLADPFSTKQRFFEEAQEITAPVADEARQAHEAFRAGDYTSMYGHGLGAVPLIGKPVLETAHEYATGQFGKAVAHTGELLAPFVLHEPIGRGVRSAGFLSKFLRDESGEIGPGAGSRSLISPTHPESLDPTYRGRDFVEPPALPPQERAAIDAQIAKALSTNAAPPDLAAQSFVREAMQNILEETSLYSDQHRAARLHAGVTREEDLARMTPEKREEAQFKDWWNAPTDERYAAQMIEELKKPITVSPAEYLAQQQASAFEWWRTNVGPTENVARPGLLESIKRTVLDQTGSIGPGAGRRNVSPQIKKFATTLASTQEERAVGTVEPEQRARVEQRIQELVGKYGDPKITPTMLGHGQEKAAYDIGAGNILKVNYPDSRFSGGITARERLDESLKVNKFLGEHGTPPIAFSARPFGDTHVEMEIYRKLQVATDRSPEEFGAELYRKTGIISDPNYGNYGYDPANPDILKLIDLGLAEPGTPVEARQWFDTVSADELTPPPNIKDIIRDWGWRKRRKDVNLNTSQFELETGLTNPPDSDLSAKSSMVPSAPEPSSPPIPTPTPETPVSFDAEGRIHFPTRPLGTFDYNPSNRQNAQGTAKFGFAGKTDDASILAAPSAPEFPDSPLAVPEQARPFSFKEWIDKSGEQINLPFDHHDAPKFNRAWHRNTPSVETAPSFPPAPPESVPEAIFGKPPEAPPPPVAQSRLGRSPYGFQTVGSELAATDLTQLPGQLFGALSNPVIAPQGTLPRQTRFTPDTRGIRVPVEGLPEPHESWFDSKARELFKFTTGALVPADPGGGAFHEGFVTGWDVTSTPGMVKRYAYDVPLEEYGKAQQSFRKGNYGMAAGHSVAAIPGTGLVSDVVGAQIEVFQRGVDELKRGEYTEAISHFVESGVPIVGPNATALRDDFKSGDPERVKYALGVLTSYATANAIPFMGAPKALRALKVPATRALNTAAESLRYQQPPVGQGYPLVVRQAAQRVGEIAQHPIQSLRDAVSPPEATAARRVIEGRSEAPLQNPVGQTPLYGYQGRTNLLGGTTAATYDFDAGAIFLNRRLPVEQQAQFLVHESAHAAIPEPLLNEIAEARPVRGTGLEVKVAEALDRRGYIPEGEPGQVLRPRDLTPKQVYAEGFAYGTEEGRVPGLNAAESQQFVEAMLAEAEKRGRPEVRAEYERLRTLPREPIVAALRAQQPVTNVAGPALANRLRSVIDEQTGFLGPQHPQAYQFYSPNEAENLTFGQAVEGLREPPQQRLLRRGAEIDRALGIRGQQLGAIGDTAEHGTEPSVLNVISKAPSFEAIRYSAALKGDLANQKAVIPFQVQEKGPDTLYRVTVPQTPAETSRSLDQEQIQYRTLVPKGKLGTEVVIYDQGSQLGENVERFAERYNVEPESARGRGEFLGGETREAGREAYHRVINQYEAQTGARLHERVVRHGLPDVATGTTVPGSQPGGDRVAGALPATSTTGRPPANLEVQEIAQQYNQQYGRPAVDHSQYPEVNQPFARDVASAYDNLQKFNQSPHVARAYSAFADEVKQQYDFATAKGIRFEPWTQEGQPYANSNEMATDVAQNKHLYFYTGGEPHPLLGEIDSETGLSRNDQFRAVHDLFGHAAGGFGFGARGEEGAFRAHFQMFGDEAKKAMATETRGQNSWVNFGRQNYGASGERLTIPPEKRPFAEQKVDLLPEEFSQSFFPVENVARPALTRRITDVIRGERGEIGPGAGSRGPEEKAQTIIDNLRFRSGAAGQSVRPFLDENEPLARNVISDILAKHGAGEPSYLNEGLERFAYDIGAGNVLKVRREVEYPEDLQAELAKIQLAEKQLGKFALPSINSQIPGKSTTLGLEVQPKVTPITEYPEREAARLRVLRETGIRTDSGGNNFGLDTSGQLRLLDPGFARPAVPQELADLFPVTRLTDLPPSPAENVARPALARRIGDVLRDETGAIGPGAGLRRERALESFKPATRDKQLIADQVEAEVSAALGIPRTRGNAPFDLQNERVGVEVKTLVDNSRGKITMHPESLARKREEIERTGVEPYTVAVDRRGDEPQYYFRPGLGSFSLGSRDIRKFGSLEEIKRKLLDETGGIGPDVIIPERKSVAARESKPPVLSPEQVASAFGAYLPVLQQAPPFQQANPLNDAALLDAIARITNSFRDLSTVLPDTTQKFSALTDAIQQPVFQQPAVSVPPEIPVGSPAGLPQDIFGPLPAAPSFIPQPPTFSTQAEDSEIPQSVFGELPQAPAYQEQAGRSPYGFATVGEGLASAGPLPRGILAGDQSLPVGRVITIQRDLPPPPDIDLGGPFPAPEVPLPTGGAPAYTQPLIRQQAVSAPPTIAQPPTRLPEIPHILQPQRYPDSVQDARQIASTLTHFPTQVPGGPQVRGLASLGTGILGNIQAIRQIRALRRYQQDVARARQAQQLEQYQQQVQAQRVATLPTGRVVALPRDVFPPPLPTPPELYEPQFPTPSQAELPQIIRPLPQSPAYSAPPIPAPAPFVPQVYSPHPSPVFPGIAPQPISPDVFPALPPASPFIPPSVTQAAYPQVSQFQASPYTVPVIDTTSAAPLLGSLPQAPAYQEPLGPVYTPDTGIPNFQAETTEYQAPSYPELEQVFAPPTEAPAPSATDDLIDDLVAKLSAQQGPTFDAGVHARTISSGLQGTLGPGQLNIRGAEIVPQAVKDAAHPFGGVGAAFHTLETAGQGLLAGLQAGGLTGPNAGEGGQTNVNFAALLHPGGGSGAGFGLGTSGFVSSGGYGTESSSQAFEQNFATTGMIGDLPQAPADNSKPGYWGGPVGVLSKGLVVAGGVEGVLAGLHEGGARGGLTTATSILGTAAALDPEPISKAILGIAAGVTAMIHAFLPDPRAVRREQLTKEIEQGREAAFPFTQPGINVEESATGHLVNTDYLGNVREMGSRPNVYTVNEAVGFDPLHEDRVIARPVRQVGWAPYGQPNDPNAPILLPGGGYGPPPGATSTNQFSVAQGSQAPHIEAFHGGQTAEEVEAQRPHEDGGFFSSLFGGHNPLLFGVASAFGLGPGKDVARATSPIISAFTGNDERASTYQDGKPHEDSNGFLGNPMFFGLGSAFGLGPGKDIARATMPIVNTFMGHDDTAKPVYTDNPMTRQDKEIAGLQAQVAGIQNQITHNYNHSVDVQMPIHAMDVQDLKRRGRDFADAIDEILRTSTHPLSQTVRNAVTAT